MLVKNVHARKVSAPIDLVRPWIEESWSGTERDPFPCDVVKSWRRNPPDVASGSLVPGVTRLGHGPFSFRFESWDGARWRVRVEGERGFRGWRGLARARAIFRKAAQGRAERAFC
jgi:hypothetical protein